MENQKKDQNHLDNVFEDSVFSITEDAQYPLFDADKAKEILGKKKNSNSPKKNNRNKKTAKRGFKQELNRSGSNFRMKSNDFPESVIKLDEPINLKKESLASFGGLSSTPAISRFGSNKLGSGTGRQIGLFRNTSKPIPVKTTQTINVKGLMNKQNELSPRSKMMPELAERYGAK